MVRRQEYVVKDSEVFEGEEVTVVSGKGQVVIPQSLREKLGLRPKTKLVVYGYKDSVIMKKMDVSEIVRDLKSLYHRVDARSAKYGKLTDEEINEIVKKHRKRSAE